MSAETLEWLQNPEAGLRASGWLGFGHHRTTCSLGFASFLAPAFGISLQFIHGGPCLDQAFLEEPGQRLVA